MQPILKRFSIRLSRGGALLLLICGGIVAGAFWIGPLRPLPAELQLLAQVTPGRYAGEVQLDASGGVASPTPGANIRLPLVLGVRNVGAQPVRPTALYLSLPAHFRLLDGHGTPLPVQHDTGNPLVRIRIPLNTELIPPDSNTVRLLPGDTLWLEPALPSYYCVLLPDGVPDFLPAPAVQAELVARFQVFYSFSAPSTARQTGLLEMEMDPSLVRTEPAPVPPAFPITYHEPAAPLPELGPLVKIGSRTEQCSDPDLGVSLQSVLWQNESGGRFFVLYAGGQPRKYLFDLNADDVIDLEIFDQDGDGRFEARRPARFRTPAFLIPVPEPVADTTQLVQPDSLPATPPDSVERAAAPATGVRSDSPRPQPPRADTVRRDTVRRDTVRRDTLRRDTVRRDTLRRDTVRRDTLDHESD